MTKSRRFAAALAAGIVAATILPGCTSSIPKPQSQSAGQSGTSVSPQAQSQAQSAEQSQSADSDVSDFSTSKKERPTGQTQGEIIANNLMVGTEGNVMTITVSFTGSGDLGWVVESTEAPTTQGKGDPVNIDGPNWLDVSILGTTTPYEPSQQEMYYSGPSELEENGVRVYFDGTYEDTTHLVIGMDGDYPWTVNSTSDPLTFSLSIQLPQ